MKKETQFLCIVLLCSLTLMVSGCGIRPSDLMSPSEAEQERAEKAGEIPKTDQHHKKPTFPATYPKAAR